MGVLGVFGVFGVRGVFADVIRFEVDFGVDGGLYKRLLHYIEIYTLNNCPLILALIIVGLEIRVF